MTIYPLNKNTERPTMHIDKNQKISYFIDNCLRHYVGKNTLTFDDRDNQIILVFLFALAFAAYYNHNVLEQ